MKLLILTQKVDMNDDVLGFMHGWIKEFAKNCESVIVVCLQEGKHELPENVKILSLGKEGGASRFKYLFNFYKYIWREKKNYDKVFVHMNKEYVILGGLLWRILDKKIGFWYAHGYAPFSLRVAEKLAHIILTSTKSGLRLKSEKVNVVGQGIDIDKFRIVNHEPRAANKVFGVITVGRISPVKGYDTLIKAIEVLNKKGINIKADIIGGAGLPDQEEYLNNLKKAVKERKLEEVINFVGVVPNKNIANHLQSSDLFVNMSGTGSLDKAMVEAMASGLPVLTCNESMEEVLGEFKDLLMYDKEDYKGLAEKIKIIKNIGPKEREDLGKRLRDIAEANHSQEELIGKITNILGK